METDAHGSWNFSFQRFSFRLLISDFCFPNFSFCYSTTDPKRDSALRCQMVGMPRCGVRSSQRDDPTFFGMDAALWRF